MELEPFDFGPIVPDGCCGDDSSGEVTDGFAPDFAPVRSNFVILAHKNDPICGCKDRKFTVNLHKDGSWSFTYTNGEPLSQQAVDTYCHEIAAAQSYLENYERWRHNGRDIGLWDPNKNFGATGNGARADDGTIFFPAARSDGSYSPGTCSVQRPVNPIQ